MFRRRPIDLKCLRCEICGKPIKTGFLCDKCSRKEKNRVIDDDDIFEENYTNLMWYSLLLYS
jgi:hypothetical protein